MTERTSSGNHPVQQGWAFFSIGVLAGAGVALAAMSAGAGKIPDGLGALVGGFMGGGAALITAAVAVRGFHRWEERRTKEKLSDIAIEALAATVSYCGQLQSALGILSIFGGREWHTSISTASKERVLAMFTGSELKRFDTARVQVDLFFDKGVSAPLQEVAAVAATLTLALTGESFLAVAHATDSRPQIEAQLKGISEQLAGASQKLIQLQAKAADILRPHALIGVERKQ